MSVLGAFVSHEATTQFRSARFKIVAIAYAVITCIPAIVLYVTSRRAGYALDGGSYASALQMLQPSMTALFATVLAVDAITREREEGSFGVISLAPMTASSYVFLRWMALLLVAIPVTLLPSAIAAVLAAHAERRIPDVAPLAWEWLLHVAPPLVVMSALMLALGTITGRTILAILLYGAAMTFGLGFLQDALAFAHRKLEGPGDMIGLDPMIFNRLIWTVRGYWNFDPPTAAGYPIEQELDRLLPESALIVAFAFLFIAVTPAFLRRTRADVKPWRIRDDHPVRTMLRGINRIRENYRPDAGLQPADRVVMVIGLIAATGCLAFLLNRETRFMRMASERFAAQTTKEPREMSLSLVPRVIRVEGEAGRTIRTKTMFEIENRGAEPEQHLAFAVHPGLAIQSVHASCAEARVTRVWERVGIDLDKPIAARGVCTITIDLAGKPDSVLFNLAGKGRFSGRYRHWQRGTKAIDLSDLSRSTFRPAATRQRLLLTAADFAPVPRHTPWNIDTEPIPVDRDTTSFVRESLATATDIRLSLRLPEGFTATDSCGAVSTKKIESRCTFAFPDFRITCARFVTTPLGRGTLVHFKRHSDLARVHAPAVSDALTIAERAWPGLNLAGTPVFVERPIDGDGDHARYYNPLLSGPIEASGSMYSIPESLFVQRKPLQPPQIGAALISSTLRGRRALQANEQLFFHAFYSEIARVRIGAGDSRSAVIGGKGPRPSTDPLRHMHWSGRDRLRGVLADLEYRAGSDRIVEAVNEFASMRGTGSAKELLEVIGRRANVNLDNMYRDYFDGQALPKLSIEEAAFVRDGNRWTVRGFVHNLGTGETFCPVVLRTQFGSVRQTVRVGTGERVPFVLSTDYEPRTLQLDPERVVYRHAAIGTVDSIDFKGES